MMFKSLFCVFVCFVAFHLNAKVEARWLSVAAVVFDDGETKILFDPAFTRPHLGHWLGMSEFRSDEALVSQILNQYDLKNVKALFVSHSHFDHAVDAPMVAKLTGATFFTDKNTEIIAKAYLDPNIKTRKILNKERIQIGKFSITPVLCDHAIIRAINLHFLPGSVMPDFDFGFYDYKVGDTWFYIIEHPDGTILMDQGGHGHVDKAVSLIKHVDVLYQGISNRESDDDFLGSYLGQYKPKIFIPNHFDNFFTKFDPEKKTFLPGIGMDELLVKIRMRYPKTKVINPRFGERMGIL